jgi:hypothetical protein
MRDPEDLRESLVSVDESLEHDLKNEITHPYAECEYLGELMWGMHGFYRTRGILKYLLDADTEAFFADLSREALTYVTFLRAYRASMDVPESRVTGSTYSPLSCALATANFGLCAEIDQLMPREIGDYDEDEAFAFTTALRSLATGNERDIDSALRAFAKGGAGVERYPFLIEIVRGLAERNEKRFNDALAAYLASFDGLSADEAREMLPGAEYVNVEALALIQLGRKRNLTNRVQHRMIPPELQDARTVVPTDGYPAWPG